MKPGDEHPALELEIKLLQALCASGWSSLSGGLKARLGRYSWRDPGHQILFEALQQIPATPAECAQEYLQGALVRLGFPDIAFEIGASREHPSEEELEKILQEMESRPRAREKGGHRDGSSDDGIHHHR